MASSPEFVEYVLDQVRGPWALRGKKMFGEHMVYVNEKPILLVCDDTVFVKRIPEIASLMEGAETGFPYSGAKEHWVLDVDDSEAARRVIAAIESATPRPKPRRARQPSKPAAAPSGPFYHGTKAALTPGDLLTTGRASNFGSRREARHLYLTATLDAAVWGAELAIGDGPGRIYLVEPTGEIEDDPNLTDKRYPGNPTKSYRTRKPLRVVGEVAEWTPHPPEVLQAMLDGLERLKAEGVEAIDD